MDKRAEGGGRKPMSRREFLKISGGFALSLPSTKLPKNKVELSPIKKELTVSTTDELLQAIHQMEEDPNVPYKLILSGETYSISTRKNVDVPYAHEPNRRRVSHSANLVFPARELEITGLEGKKPIIEFQNGADISMYFSDAHRVMLRGLDIRVQKPRGITIENITPSILFVAGVPHESNDVVIQDCALIDGTSVLQKYRNSGITTVGVEKVRVKGSSIQSCYDGIAGFGCVDMKVERSQVLRPKESAFSMGTGIVLIPYKGQTSPNLVINEVELCNFMKSFGMLGDNIKSGIIFADGVYFTEYIRNNGYFNDGFGRWLCCRGGCKVTLKGINMSSAEARRQLVVDYETLIIFNSYLRTIVKDFLPLPNNNVKPTITNSSIDYCFDKDGFFKLPDLKYLEEMGFRVRNIRSFKEKPLVVIP